MSVTDGGHVDPSGAGMGVARITRDRKSRKVHLKVGNYPRPTCSDTGERAGPWGHNQSLGRCAVPCKEGRPQAKQGRGTCHTEAFLRLTKLKRKSRCWLHQRGASPRGYKNKGSSCFSKVRIFSRPKSTVHNPSSLPCSILQESADNRPRNS